MARMTITLTEADVEKACRAYVEMTYNTVATTVKIRATPTHDHLDRPTGTYVVAVEVACEPLKPPGTR